MTLKKTIFLFLALLLPIAVFLFLKLFGANEFRVPVRHQHGPIAAPEDCPLQYRAPYRVPDSAFAALQLNGDDSLYVFYFDRGLSAGLKRIPAEFRAVPVRLVGPSEMPADTDAGFLRRCILLMRGDSSVALVDHQKRIRGYYAGADRDEVDRLIVEMKIILKQY